MITSLPRRIKNRALREAVDRLGVPSSWVGYQRLKAESPEAHVRRRQQQEPKSLARHEVVEPSRQVRYPLPMNVASREELTRALPSFPISFYEVPDRLSRETAIITIPDCRIALCHDEWGHEFYALVTRDDRLIHARGTSFRNEHAPVLRSTKCARMERASWVLEIWANNYFHWLVYHLPKIALLMERGLDGRILLPKQNRAYAMIENSLERMGLDASKLPRLDAPLIQVDELTLVELDVMPGGLLNRVREMIAGPVESSPDRMVFISREKADRRRLKNENEVWPGLQRAGYEQVAMETLSFDEQVSLMRKTRVLLAPSGAGLANMLFCPPGTHIVEMSDPDYRTADFYALASALGHNYWLLPAQGVVAEEPGARDLMVDPNAVSEVVRTIGSLLGPQVTDRVWAT